VLKLINANFTHADVRIYVEQVEYSLHIS